MLALPSVKPEAPNSDTVAVLVAPEPEDGAVTGISKVTAGPPAAIALGLVHDTTWPTLLHPDGMAPRVQAASKVSTTCAPLAGTTGCKAALLMPMRGYDATDIPHTYGWVAPVEVAEESEPEPEADVEPVEPVETVAPVDADMDASERGDASTGYVHVPDDAIPPRGE